MHKLQKHDDANSEGEIARQKTSFGQADERAQRIVSLKSGQKNIITTTTTTKAVAAAAAESVVCIG